METVDKLKFKLDVEIKVGDKKVKCVTHVNGQVFVCSKTIQPQADRVSSVKRAKQLAYVGCMHKFHGYACDLLKIGE